jgi:hypothetical protein
MTGGKSTRYPFSRRLGGPQSRSGRLTAENFGSNTVLISGNSPVDQEGRVCWKLETSSRIVIMFRPSLSGVDCVAGVALQSRCRDEMTLGILRQIALHKFLSFEVNNHLH